MTIKTLAFTETSPGIRVKEKTVTLVSQQKSEKSYKLDGSYLAESGYTQAFSQHMSKPTQKVLSGHNVSIVGFSQNMIAKNSIFEGDSGLVALGLREIFQQIGKTTDFEYLVSVSMLQVKNDGKCTDLLNPSGRKLELQNHSHQGLYVDGLSFLVCPSSEDTLRLFEDGCQVENSLKLTPFMTYFTVHVLKQPKAGRKGNSSIGSLKFVRIFAEKKHLPNVLAILSTAAQRKSHGFDVSKPITESLLMVALVGNVDSFLIASVFGKDENEMLLSAIQPLSGVGSPPKEVHHDNLVILQRLRQEIASVRNRLAAQSVPNKADISQMENLVHDLDQTKKSAWDQIILRSEQFYEERKTSYSNKGLLWILESTKPANREKLLELQRRRDKLVEEYKNQRQITSKLSAELKMHIDDYTQAVKSGRQDDKDDKSRVAKIQELKEQFRKETDKLKEIETKQKAFEEKLMKERQEGLEESSSSFDVVFRAMVEEREKLKQENHQLVEEELEKMKIDVDHAKAELQMRFSSNSLVQSNDEVLTHAIELATLRSEKIVITTQLDALKHEKSQMEDQMRILAEKHSREMEIQQLQSLQTFRAYREVFEEFKVELENRWRGLLDDAIQDAVFLNARNTEMMENNTKLQLEVAQLKDDRSIKPSRANNKA
ncbi:uncharacterized protein LOC143471890 [Clavelina lepadiformis]|uniref:uncharacterized protein LOC143471890 n=1 Tax=Clavelina lepadiformis TaxID=159417 RepID=UPI004042C825